MKKLLLLLLLIPAICFAKDYERSVTIKITDDSVNISDYFNPTTTVRWSIDDPSVLNIVDNKIIPIKVGETFITANTTTDTYKLNITVSNEKTNVTNTNNKDINQVMSDIDVKNPRTGDEVILLVMVIILSLLVTLFFKSKLSGRYE